MSIEKLQSLTGLLVYPDENDSTIGTTEEQMQEYIKNQHGIIANLVDNGLWQPSTAYEVGQVITSKNMVRNTVARVITAGTTGTAEPAWTAAGNTLVDGTVTYAILYRTIDYATQDEVTAGKNGTKIVTPAMLGQTVQVDLASEKAVDINGTDKTVLAGVTGILPISHGGTGSDHLPYTPTDGTWDGTHFPVIGTDGGSEVGKYVDFHEAANDGKDYAVRLQSSGGKLLVNGTDIMQYIANVQSAAGVIAGNVSNTSAWWVKLGGTIPLIIQGGRSSVSKKSWVGFPLSFSSLLSVVAVQADQNECQYFLYNTGTTGFNYGGNMSYSHILSWIAIGY